MMEKSGTVILTEKDLEDYKEGRVSLRLQEEWGLTFEELRNIIETNNYKVNT